MSIENYLNMDEEELTQALSAMTSAGRGALLQAVQTAYEVQEECEPDEENEAYEDWLLRLEDLDDLLDILQELG